MSPPVVRYPSGWLAQFVDCFWIHCGYCQPHPCERVLPTGTADVVFAVDDTGRSRSSIAGPRSTFLELDTSRPFTAAGIHFLPGGTSPFFGMPISELENQTAPLDLFWGNFAATVADRLWSADASDEQLSVLEQALQEKARQPLVRHQAVSYAVKRFERSHGARSVEQVAEELGMSPRRLLDVFRSEIGLAPKTFCRIRRFAAVLRDVERTAAIDWSEIALTCGYFDQAHFNHEFRAFSGVNPSTYRQHQTSRTHVAIR